MKVLYARCSSLEQKTDRQKVNEKDFSLVLEDKCSGAIPFFERPAGKEIKELVDNGIITSIACWSIDRMGRSLHNILETIHYFNEKGISINFISQGLSTLDEKGKENPISKMVISILGVVAEMNRVQIREAQMQGIKLAQLRGNVFKGRVVGSKEDVLAFLSKEKNKKALDYLKKGYKGVEAAKLAGVHLNTVTKIKKLGLSKA